MKNSLTIKTGRASILCLGMIAAVSPLEGSIFFVNTDSNATYTAGTDLTFDANEVSRPQFTGIELTASANLDGNKFYASGGQIRYDLGQSLAMGDSLTFTFDFNMQLFSGPASAFDPALTGNIRSAALFRVAPFDIDNYSFDGTWSATMAGGADSLQNYFGTPLPADGALTHSNSGVLNFNDGSGSLAQVNNRASYDATNSFNGNDDTVVFTEAQGATPDTTQMGVGIVDPGRTSQDFSFQSWTFTFTNEGGDIPEDTSFLFTFEGYNPAAQLALVPEPASTSLLALGALLVVSRRRRFHSPFN